MGHSRRNDWEARRDKANEVLSQASEDLAKIEKRTPTHNRGTFSALPGGISFGGGQQMPMNKSMSVARAGIFERLLNDEHIQEIAAFGSSEYGTSYCCTFF